MGAVYWIVGLKQEMHYSARLSGVLPGWNEAEPNERILGISQRKQDLQYIAYRLKQRSVETVALKTLHSAHTPNQGWRASIVSVS
jgi:hypothetical protein